MIKVMPIFGTRPEGIKMAPVVRTLKECSWAEAIVTATGQHREMLDQVLEIFGIKPDHDLNVMSKGQDLYDVTSRVILGLRDLLRSTKPDIVLVQGDTTTVMAGALAASYENIPVGHIEAGLRTQDKRNPFPEEINRRLTSVLTDLHFAPTEQAQKNLLDEGINPAEILVTGNTVIDALLWALEILKDSNNKELKDIQNWTDKEVGDKKIILITAHRRESFGKPFEDMCHAMRDLALKYPELRLVYPVHLNPNVRKPVYEILKDVSNVHLIEPVSYLPFVWLMQRSHIILTDSGGVQEEAPSLGKPVLVMRETTERPEGIEAGTSILVGRDRSKIVGTMCRLLDDTKEYEAIACRNNPYGDGKSSLRICESIRNFFQA